MRQIAKIDPSTPPAKGAPGRTGQLTNRQKAAIIVRFLLQEGAEVPLSDLPDDLQTALTQQMGTMRYIDRETLATVVGEFADELERMGLTFPRGLAGALTALDGKISPQTAARLRKEAGVRCSGDPWALIREQEVDKLVPLVEQESTEVAAVLLAKLSVPKAAELLSKIPGEKARRITYAVSLTGAVTPEAVDRIGLSLAAQFEMAPPRAFDKGPEERLGAILNVSQADTRDEVLTGLDEADIEFSARVRKAIFTFGHIAERLQTVDVPKITRDVDPGQLVIALAYASTASEPFKLSAEFILDNISKRMAENIREEIREAGKIKPKDGEAAMNEVVTAIRDLADTGEISLVEPDEDEDDG